jgi:hypothetical protein
MKLEMLIVALTCLLLVGCGSAEVFETTKVSGQVTYRGKPLNKVQVKFMPDKENGNNSSFTSVGETDASGTFNLAYIVSGEKREGAAIGAHRVVLLDLLPYESRDGNEDLPGKTKRSRVPPKFTSLTTSDLNANVTADSPTTVNFELTK